MSRNTKLPLKLLTNDSKDEIFFSSAFNNLVFSDEKKFGFEYHFNTQNDRVRSRNGDEGSHVVARKQCLASVMV